MPTRVIYEFTHFDILTYFYNGTSYKVCSFHIFLKHYRVHYYNYQTPSLWILFMFYAMHVALLLNKLFQTLKFEVINMVNNQQIQNLGLLQFLFHGGVRYISVVIKDTFSIKVWRILLAYNDVDKTKRLILSDADRPMFALWKKCMHVGIFLRYTKKMKKACRYWKWRWIIS